MGQLHGVRAVSVHTPDVRRVAARCGIHDVLSIAAAVHKKNITIAASHQSPIAAVEVRGEDLVIPIDE